MIFTKLGVLLFIVTNFPFLDTNLYKIRVRLRTVRPNACVQITNRSYRIVAFLHIRDAAVHLHTLIS